MTILSHTPSIPPLLQSKTYRWPLNSTSNGAFKNRINPISKVHFKGEQMHFFEPSKTPY